MEIKKDRVKLSFEEVGPQDAFVHRQQAPVILMHGLTSAKETWEAVMKPLAESTNRKVYAFDFRNHGDSGWSKGHDYNLMQDDLEQFMECMHLKKAVLVGHSMGGKVAMFFALRKPDMVEKLIVEDILPTSSSTNIREYVKKYLDDLLEAVEKIPSHINNISEAKEFVADFLRNLSTGEYVEAATLPLTVDENGTFKWKTNLKAIEESFTSGFGVPRTLQGQYKGPTLILYGTKSPYYKKSEEGSVSDFFPSAIFEPVEGSAHQIHLEFKDVFLKAVSNFINRSGC